MGHRTMKILEGQKGARSSLEEGWILNFTEESLQEILPWRLITPDHSVGILWLCTEKSCYAVRCKASSYSLIANIQLPIIIFEIYFLTERLLQGSTEKAVSTSALLVWLLKGSWWASYPICSHLLLQLSTPSAVLCTRECSYFQWGYFQWCCG